MSAKGNASRKRHDFRGPSRHDTYTVWVDFRLTGDRKKVFGSVAKALRGGGARSTGRKWLTQMAKSGTSQELAVFIPGCTKALARVKRVNATLKKLGVKGTAKAFHEALYSTRNVTKCPRY